MSADQKDGSDSSVSNEDGSDEQSGEDVADTAQVAIQRNDPELAKELFIAVATELVHQKKIFTKTGRQLFQEMYKMPGADTGVQDPDPEQGNDGTSVPSTSKAEMSIALGKGSPEASTRGTSSTRVPRGASSSSGRRVASGRGPLSTRETACDKNSQDSATRDNPLPRGLPKARRSLPARRILPIRGSSMSSRAIPAARGTPAADDNDSGDSSYDPVILSNRSLNVLDEGVDVLPGSLLTSPNTVAGDKTHPGNVNPEPKKTTPQIQKPKQVEELGASQRPEKLNFTDLTDEEKDRLRAGVRNKWSPSIEEKTIVRKGRDPVPRIVASKDLHPGEFVTYLKGRAMKREQGIISKGAIYLGDKHSHTYLELDKGWAGNCIAKKAGNEANCSIIALKLGKTSPTIFCMFARIAISKGSLLSWCP